MTHAYVEGGDGDCAECSGPYVVHPEPAYEGPPPVDLGIVACPDCGHDPHTSPCRFTRTLYVTVQTGAVKQVCGCRERAA